MIKKLLISALLVLAALTSTSLKGQTETDERAFIKFDKGLEFFDPDSIFGINLRFRMQNRLQLTTESDEDFTIVKTEALVRRLRLRFDGYLGTPRFTYYLQLAFSRSDQDWDGSHEPNIIRDAMIYYNFTHDFYIGFGQGKLPGNRQRIISSGAQQFLDRGLSNNAFNIDRDFGIFAYYTLFGHTMPLNIKGAISSGEGRNSPSTGDGYAYTGRIEWLPLGPFAKDGDFSEGDFEKEKKLRVSVAAGFSLNQKAIKNLGQRGENLTKPHDISSAFADIILKYRGFAFYAEFMNRATKGTAWDGLPAENRYVLTGYGLTTQLSYLLGRNYEVAARYSMVNPDKEIELSEPKARTTTVGFNKYLNKHKVKLQLNISRREEILPGNTHRDLQMGFQVEVGI